MEENLDLSDGRYTDGYLEALEPRRREKLKYLSLSFNHIVQLPLIICDLMMLTKLYFALNGLQSLPWEIGQLTNLQHLYLGNNKLRELPASLGQCYNLRGLFLNDNGLTRLPPTLIKLSLLKSLTLNDGNSLPEEFEICEWGNHDGVQSHLKRIFDRFSYRGSRNAALVLCTQSAHRVVHKDVVRYILVPMLFAPRTRSEWPEADEKAWSEGQV